MATVFDETGRPVHRYQNFTVYTQPVFIGIKNTDEYVDTRVPVKIGLIAVDKNENIQSLLCRFCCKKRMAYRNTARWKLFKYVSQQDEKIISQQK